MNYMSAWDSIKPVYLVLVCCWHTSSIKVYTLSYDISKMAELVDNNITSNNTMDLDLPTGGGNYSLITVSAIGAIVSVLCLLYITLKLVLNKFIKTILSIFALNHTLCFTSMTISNAVMIGNTDRSELMCRLLMLPFYTIFQSTLVFLTLLSVLR